MSVRSSLAAPSPQSGAIGTTLKYGQGGDVPLISGASPLQTAVLTLSRGVWAISATTKLFISANTSIGVYQPQLVVGGSSLITDQRYSGAFGTSTADAYLENQFANVVVSITTDGTAVQLLQSANFFGGTGVNSMIVDGTYDSLCAVKLA